ncbi:MAG: hypothetical protein ACFFB0_15600 [Promethearchaeota archaeon]
MIKIYNLWLFYVIGCVIAYSMQLWANKKRGEPFDDPEFLFSDQKIVVIAMAWLFGGFIDLFPFFGAAVGIIDTLIIGIQGYFSLVIFSLLIVITIIFTILTVVFDKLLRGGTCKKCANFSGVMNKTTEDVRVMFFQQNPTMAKAWKK